MLQGKGPSDLDEITYAFAEEMLALCDVKADPGRWSPSAPPSRNGGPWSRLRAEIPMPRCQRRPSGGRSQPRARVIDRRRRPGRRCLGMAAGGRTIPQGGPGRSRRRRRVPGQAGRSRRGGSAASRAPHQRPEQIEHAEAALADGFEIGDEAPNDVRLSSSGSLRELSGRRPLRHQECNRTLGLARGVVLGSGLSDLRPLSCMSIRSPSRTSTACRPRGWPDTPELFTPAMSG